MSKMMSDDCGSNNWLTKLEHGAKLHRKETDTVRRNWA